MAVRFEQNATSRQRHALHGYVSKSHHRISGGCHLKLTCLLPQCFLCSRVEHLHRHFALDSLLCQVIKRGRKRGMVAHPYETGQVKPGHHVLGCHRRVRKRTRHHIFRMSQSHEFPCRQAFRQGETYRHLSVLIGHQTRIKESRLVQIPTDRDAHFIVFILPLSLRRHETSILHTGGTHQRGRTRTFFQTIINLGFPLRNSLYIFHRFSPIQEIRPKSIETQILDGWNFYLFPGIQRKIIPVVIIKTIIYP